MKSDIVVIDNMGKGFSEAISHTQKVAEYMGVSHDDSITLQLITEEMLSMAHSITGEIKASFWLEAEGATYMLHLSTETVMDKEKRNLLIEAATSRKNEAAKGFLSKLRDAFESMMIADVTRNANDLPDDLFKDVPNILDDPEWDGFEGSVLKNLADEIKIGIRGKEVDMTVIKVFAQ